MWISLCCSLLPVLTQIRQKRILQLCINNPWFGLVVRWVGELLCRPAFQLFKISMITPNWRAQHTGLTETAVIAEDARLAYLWDGFSWLFLVGDAKRTLKKKKRWVSFFSEFFSWGLSFVNDEAPIIVLVACWLLCSTIHILGHKRWPVIQKWHVPTYLQTTEPPSGSRVCFSSKSS